MKAQERLAAVAACKPLILLFDSRSLSDRARLSKWLATHSFSSYEASDALDALDLLSDFTTASLPEIVTIPGGVQDDPSTVSRMLCSFMSVDADLPVYLYSQERNAGTRCLSIEEVGQWLERRRSGGES